MTREYRTEKLAQAEIELSAAYERLQSLPPNRRTARRTAAEDVEFWGNKVAFLSNPNIEDWA